MKTLALALIPFVLASGIALLAAATHEPGHNLGSLGDVHWHARFELLINGDKFDFSGDKYQVVASEVHFESGDGDTIHVHASGMTLGHAFSTLKFKLTTDCLALDTGQQFCQGGKNKLEFVANGQPVADPAGYIIRDGDALALRYTGDLLVPPIKTTDSALRWVLVGLGTVLLVAAGTGIARSRYRVQHAARAERRRASRGKASSGVPVALAVLPIGGLMLVGGLVFMAPGPAVAEPGDFALLNYVAYGPDGLVLETSASDVAGLSPSTDFDTRFSPEPFYVGTQAPPRPPVGWGASQRMPQKLFETVSGMREGEVRTTTAIENPYGPPDPNLVETSSRTETMPRVVTLARSDIRGDVAEGAVVQARARAGITWPATVLNATETQATVRLDPPNGSNLPILPWPVRVQVGEDVITLVHEPQPGRYRDGVREFRVQDVGEDAFTVDFNHPLAGKTVIFKVKLERIVRLTSGAGPRVPDFTLADIDGNNYQFATFRGKPVLVFTMATWCTPCIREMPELLKVRERYGDDIVMINLDVDPTETEQEVRGWRDQFGADWIFAFDRGNDAVKALGVRSLSTAIVVSAGGEKIWSGADPPASKLFEVIERARTL